jgi:hypothetical protein
MSGAAGASLQHGGVVAFLASSGMSGRERGRGGSRANACGGMS